MTPRVPLWFPEPTGSSRCPSAGQFCGRRRGYGIQKRSIQGARTDMQSTSASAVLALAAMLTALAPVVARADASWPCTGSEPTCNGFVPTLCGTDGPDNIVGTSGPDVIVGLGANDRIDGGGGDDSIGGGPGDDLLIGANGNDQLFGGPGKDELRGGDGDDILRGGPGDDVLFGGPGDDILAGNGGTDVCNGGAGLNDTAKPSCET